MQIKYTNVASERLPNKRNKSSPSVSGGISAAATATAAHRNYFQPSKHNEKRQHHHSIRRSIIPLIGLFLLGVGMALINRLDFTIYKESQEVDVVVDDEDNDKHTTIISASEEEEEILIRPKYCSNAQLDKIYSTFKTPFNSGFHTPIFKRTHCPNEEWARAYFQNKNKQDDYNNKKKQFLGINVGCNKGLDAIEMARLLSRDTNISVKEWNNALKSKSRPLCGIPHDMTFPSDQSASSALTDNNNNSKAYGHIHCIEPMPSTVDLLKDTLKKLGTDYEDSIIVTKAAMSNYTGTALFPNDLAGFEATSLKDCEGVAVEEVGSRSCVKVPVYSLDDFMREQGKEQQQQRGGNVNSAKSNDNNNNNNNVHPNNNNSNNNIDMLLIDAEGYDYEVLQGARETLKRVTYLLFEVHVVGNWMNHSLSKTIDTILSDFTCYWAGNNQLWRITNCMNKDLEELYEHKSWSNIACVHQRETELGNIMENVFLRTIR